MRKLQTEEIAELGISIASLFMAVIFGWSLSAKEPVTIAISVITLMILLSLDVLLILRRLKSDTGD